MAIKLAGDDVLGVDPSRDTGHWLCALAPTAAADQVSRSPVTRCPPINVRALYL